MISKEGITVEACNRMVKLDSFLKECSRLHPPAAGMPVYVTRILFGITHTNLSQFLPTASVSSLLSFQMVSPPFIGYRHAFPLFNDMYLLSVFFEMRDITLGFSLTPYFWKLLGTVLKTGSHVGVPSGWIHRSSKTYEDPDHFDCYRFVKSAAAGAKNTRFTDLSPDYLVFGMGVHAW